MQMILIFALVALAVAQRTSIQERADARRARFQDDNGQTLNGDQRRAFIQGQWDARRFARGRNVFTPRAPADAGLAAVYERGQSAWRRRGAPVPNSDKQAPPKYVDGTWPVMCPNNGMGLETIAKLLGAAGTSATVGTGIKMLVRRRTCTGFSGCGQWAISDAKTDDEQFKSDSSTFFCDFKSYEKQGPIGPLTLSMQVTKDGSELNYYLNGAQPAALWGSFLYAPKTPYSFRPQCWINPNFRKASAAVDNLFAVKDVVLSGTISNSCISFFSDLARYKNGNVVIEYQLAIYGTY